MSFFKTARDELSLESREKICTVNILIYCVSNFNMCIVLFLDLYVIRLDIGS